MSKRFKIIIFFTFILSILLTGCATTIPKPIDEEIDNIPALNLVRQDVKLYIGHRVRWGGVIANVINEKNTTIIEIVDHTLNKEGRPIETDQTLGRFLAKFQGFLDPVVYAIGREITVVGTINKETKQLIHQYEYTYPQVIVDSFVLWQQIEPRPDYYYYPYWYDPWYPPYGYYPYYYPWRYY